MRLQFLGDARDAFKWDLLHWLGTTCCFSKLVFVPLLTDDDPELQHGQSSHQRFSCRDFIRPFLDCLKTEPRRLDRIAGLAGLHPDLRFEMSIFEPERKLPSGKNRSSYWNGFDASACHNAIVFFDPDNGFETKTKRGDQWVRHDELEALFSRLPETSIMIIYQHKPHKKWPVVFSELAAKLDYVGTATAIYESTLAFVGLAKSPIAGLAISRAFAEYAQHQGSVEIAYLLTPDQSADIELAKRSAELGFRLLDKREAKNL